MIQRSRFLTFVTRTRALFHFHGLTSFQLCLHVLLNEHDSGAWVHTHLRFGLHRGWFFQRRFYYCFWCHLDFQSIRKLIIDLPLRQNIWLLSTDTFWHAVHSHWLVHLIAFRINYCIHRHTLIGWRSTTRGTSGGGRTSSSRCWWTPRSPWGWGSSRWGGSARLCSSSLRGWFNINRLPIWKICRSLWFGFRDSCWCSLIRSWSLPWTPYSFRNKVRNAISTTGFPSWTSCSVADFSLWFFVINFFLRVEHFRVTWLEKRDKFFPNIFLLIDVFDLHLSLGYKMLNHWTSVIETDT